jgi:manganese efflux pump family protein
MESILIAFALSVDSFSVAVCGGASCKMNVKQMLTVALFFAVFQGGMAAVGWIIGTAFDAIISSYDHWMAFILLSFIGIRMIWDYFKEKEHKFIFSTKVILLLALATSIDAFGIGLSYAFIEKSILIPSLVIAFVTFKMTILGITAGRMIKSIIGRKMEFIGGLILVFIGVRIVVEHTLF